jgi:hypothetical protein
MAQAAKRYKILRGQYVRRENGKFVFYKAGDGKDFPNVALMTENQVKKFVGMRQRSKVIAEVVGNIIKPDDDDIDTLARRARREASPSAADQSAGGDPDNAPIGDGDEAGAEAAAEAPQRGGKRAAKPRKPRKPRASASAEA